LTFSKFKLKSIYWLNGLFFGVHDLGLPKERVKTYLMGDGTDAAS
jgi:hypothetical protein